MPWLSRFAWLTAGLTFVLLTLGGWVHASGSSLACPDWPLCHGQVFPEMRGGVAIEHTHRLVGTLVGLCTLVVAALAWRRGGLAKKLGIASVVLVVVQGVLGGVTVLMRLSFVASMLHLAISMLFFGLLIAIALHARPFPASGRAAPGTRRWVGAALALVFVQILLGGLVRHGGAGFACTAGDLILCDGRLWPPAPSARVHILHRGVGLLVFVFVAIAAWRVLRGRSGALARALAALAPLLVLIQIGLGVLSVATLLGVVPVTAHLSVAALLVADLVVLRTLVREPLEATEPVRERAPVRSLAGVDELGAPDPQ